MLVDLPARFPDGATSAEVLTFIGLTLRREARVPRLVALESALGGVAVPMMVDELLPLTDEDIEAVFTRLVEQTEHAIAMGKIIGYEAKPIALYRARAGDAIRTAWEAVNGVMNLADSDTSVLTVRFRSAAETLGARARSIDIMHFCDLILSLQPSIAQYQVRANHGGGTQNPDDELGWLALQELGRFASLTSWLLRTSLPLQAADEGE